MLQHWSIGLLLIYSCTRVSYLYEDHVRVLVRSLQYYCIIEVFIFLLRAPCQEASTGARLRDSTVRPVRVESIAVFGNVTTCRNPHPPLLVPIQQYST